MLHRNRFPIVLDLAPVSLTVTGADRIELGITKRMIHNGINDKFTGESAYGISIGEVGFTGRSAFAKTAEFGVHTGRKSAAAGIAIGCEF